MPRSASSAALPSATALPSTMPVTPLPVTASKSAASASARPRASAPRTIASASGCSEPRSRLAASRSTSASSCPASGSTATSSGLPTVSVPVLSTISVSTVAKVSSASAFLISTPGLRAAAGRGHDRHRRREPERAGAGDDQHRDRRDQRVGERRRRPPDRPGDEGEHRDADHRRHEPAGDRVGELLDRRARALRRRDHLDDLRQHGVLADAPRLDDQAAGAVERGAGHRVAGDLLDRQRLAGQHRLVDRRAALDHLAVDRHLLARPHPQPVADRDLPRAGSPPRARRRGPPARSSAARSSSARIAEPVRSRAPSSRIWPSSTSTTMTAPASK